MKHAGGRINCLRRAVDRQCHRRGPQLLSPINSRTGRQGGHSQSRDQAKERPSSYLPGSMAGVACLLSVSRPVSPHPPGCTRINEQGEAQSLSVSARQSPLPCSIWPAAILTTALSGSLTRIGRETAQGTDTVVVRRSFARTPSPVCFLAGWQSDHRHHRVFRQPATLFTQGNDQAG